MSKDIMEQIRDLQDENIRLKEIEKLFDKAISNRFGMSSKAIDKLIKNGNNSETKSSDFEERICDYFRLDTAEDIADFESIMCCESSRKFFETRRHSGEE